MNCFTIVSQLPNIAKQTAYGRKLEKVSTVVEPTIMMFVKYMFIIFNASHSSEN